MEVKQGEIKQDMETEIKECTGDQPRRNFQKSVTQMREEYQNKLQQEVQRCSFEQSQGEKKKSMVNKARRKAK